MWRWVVVAACGCGRSGFGIEPDAQVDAPAVVDPFDAPPGSVVITFGETPSATVKGVTADTYLSSELTSATFNYGAATSLSIETTQKRTLIRFDVSALPASAQLVSARLHLNVTSLELSTTIMVSPILEAWTEGTQNGAAGVANYTQRTSTQNWTTAGAGAGSTGTSIASLQTSALGEIGLDLPIATIQSWRTTPATNFGVALSASGGDLSVSSSSNSNATGRPELVVTYFP